MQTTTTATATTRNYINRTDTFAFRTWQQQIEEATAKEEEGEEEEEEAEQRTLTKPDNNKSAIVGPTTNDIRTYIYTRRVVLIAFSDFRAILTAI